MRRIKDILIVERSESLAPLGLRPPRHAAIAGILFAFLMMTFMILVRDVIITAPSEITYDWAENHSKAVSIALVIAPFIGISFLWFTGVLRDWVIEKEDRYYASVFFASGILFVTFFFIWSAACGVLFTTLTTSIGKSSFDSNAIFTATFMNELLDQYAFRVVGLYMFTSGILWRKTGLMPLWLSMLTYIFGIGYMLFAGIISETRFIFPVWVMLVSIYILIFNYYLTHKPGNNKDVVTNKS